MDTKQFYEMVRTIVRDELKSQNIVGQWHLGTVTEVTDTKQLKVIVDAGELSQTIPCNPSVTFAVNDEVWVVYINGNARDKFVLCKRAV
jgi:hypothetical protein